MTKSDKTKKRFSTSLKQLMEKQGFHNVSVVDICRESGMHRKAFYYHFETKQDLLNWIFSRDCIEPVLELEYGCFYDAFKQVVYLMENDLAFNRLAFQLPPGTAFGTTMANSFQDYFIDQIKLLLGRYLARDSFLYQAAGKREDQYVLDTVAGSIMGNVQQWLLEHPELTAQEYLQLFYSNFVAPLMSRGVRGAA